MIYEVSVICKKKREHVPVNKQPLVNNSYGIEGPLNPVEVPVNLHMPHESHESEYESCESAKIHRPEKKSGHFSKNPLAKTVAIR